MNTSEPKSSTTSSVQRSSTDGPFFQKEVSRQGFFGSAPTQGPFFKAPPPPTLQTKLTIGAPADIYEQEADAMADKVVQKLSTGESKPTVQRACAECAAEKEEGNVAPKLQTKSMFESNDRPPAEGQVQRKCAACMSEGIQRMGEEEEPEVQAKRIQRMGEEEEPEVQAKRIQREGEEEEPEVQAKRIQRMGEEEEPEVQAKRIQRMGEEEEPEVQAKGIQRIGEEEEPEVQAKRIQRMGDEEEPEVQAKGAVPGLQASPDLESRLESTKGSGSPLPGDTRSSMESSFGADFSGVRVHTDSSAVQMNQELGAQAFTHGSDVYFNSGKYDTGSSDGQRLLAHELAHTVQQGRASSIKNENIQKKADKNIIQRTVGTTKQDSHAGLFELSKHNPLGGPTFAPQAQYDVSIEFKPYQVVDCSEIAMTQTLVSRLRGGLLAPSAAQTARQLTAAEGTEGVSIDRLSGRTSPLYGTDNAGATTATAQFGNRTGNIVGTKARIDDLPGFDGATPASSRTAGDTLSQHFETCAICNAGTDKDVYYGCVNWGYDIDAANKFTEDNFALVSKGTPSADFLAAAKKWNDQTVPVVTDDLPLSTHGTKQTSMTEAQLTAEIKTLETKLKGLAAGHIDIPQITFEIKVYKDILDAMSYNKKQGYSATDIKAIQAVIGSTPNGTYDFDTIAKIKKWQVEQGFKGDGRFGPISKKKFDAIVNAAVTANKGKGFTVDQIKKIQVKVGSNDDGTWGPITVKHLMIWQQGRSLPPTGEFNVFIRIIMFGFWSGF